MDLLTGFGKYLKGKYSLQSIFFLFSIIALPVHIWGILRAFTQFSWIAARSEIWGAVSYIFYALVFSLFESMIVFIPTLVVSLLGTVRWKQKKLAVITAALYLQVSMWMVARHLYKHYQLLNPSAWLSTALDMLYPGHIMRAQLLFAALTVLIIAICIAATIILLDRSKPVYKVVSGLFDRLMVLSIFFLFLDLIGIIVIIFRNIL